MLYNLFTNSLYLVIAVRWEREWERVQLTCTEHRAMYYIAITYTFSFSPSLFTLSLVDLKRNLENTLSRCKYFMLDIWNNFVSDRLCIHHASSVASPSLIHFIRFYTHFPVHLYVSTVCGNMRFPLVALHLNKTLHRSNFCRSPLFSFSLSLLLQQSNTGRQHIYMCTV